MGRSRREPRPEDTNIDFLYEIGVIAPSIGILLVALFVVIYGSIRSLHTDKFLNEHEELKEGVTLKTTTVLLFPVFASLGLLAYFYLWNSISIFVALSTIFAAGYAIVYSLEPLQIKFKENDVILVKDQSQSIFSGLTIFKLIIYIISLVIVLAWMSTGNWVLNDIIGISVCTLFIGFIRVPSLKLLVMLLFGLFIYDIFWVFYSSIFFGESVMEKVATQKASNPMASVVSTAPTMISLPTSIRVCGYYSCHSLGLGDMALPGTFISFIYRFESYRGAGLRLFKVAVAGYGVGLIVAFLFLVIFDVAQPALLYLVPCGVLPVVLVAFLRDTLSHLWIGGPFVGGPESLDRKNREV